MAGQEELLRLLLEESQRQSDQHNASMEQLRAAYADGTLTEYVDREIREIRRRLAGTESDQQDSETESRGEGGDTITPPPNAG